MVHARTACQEYISQEAVIECVRHYLNTEPIEDLWHDAELQGLAAKVEHDWLSGNRLSHGRR